MALEHDAAKKTIRHLVDIGGKDGILQTDTNGFNPFHFAMAKNMPNDILKFLAKVGGNEVLTHTKTNKSSEPSFTLKRKQKAVIKKLI